MLPTVKKRRLALSSARGFTLIELLVVLVIVALILSIAVPSILSSRSQRVLVASSTRFMTDLQWAMGEAQKSGVNYFLVFKFDFDPNEILGHEAGFNTFQRDEDTWIGGSYRPPDNPGVRRIATGYLIIKESPRYWSVPNQVSGNVVVPALPAEGTPFTYLDFLNELDKYNADPINYPAPVEPQYPIDVMATGAIGAPVSGPYVNRNSVPLLFYPLRLSTPSQYQSAYLGDAVIQGSLDFSAPEFQANKVFCVADTEEILAYDRVDSNASDGQRTYEPGYDHPRLNEQIQDYVLVREVDLPEGIYFVNPWKNLFPVSADRSRYADFQFIQFLYRIAPDGSFRVYEWTYSPEAFPNGDTGLNAGLVHGRADLRLTTPDFIYFFLTVEEAIDAELGFVIKETRRAQMDDYGRVITIWPLNGRVTIDAYAPNDSNAPLNPDAVGIWQPYHMRFLHKPVGASYPYTSSY